MRTKFTLRVLATFALAVTGLPAHAEEKNGLLVTVSKKTLDRNDTHTLYTTRQEKTQGLALTVKNNSIRDFPAGEVRWTIVVRKSYEGGSLKYSGKEALKPLRSAASTELVFGSALTSGYRSESYNYKDKLDYEVVITHNGKETIRATSGPGFAALAEQATSMDRPVVEPVLPPTSGRPIAVVPPGRTPGNFPPVPGTPGTVPTPVAPAVPATPANPAAPAPAAAPTTPTTPAAPVAEPIPAPAASPADAATPPPAPVPAPSGKPYDFFNLDSKAKK